MRKFTFALSLLVTILGLFFLVSAKSVGEMSTAAAPRLLDLKAKDLGANYEEIERAASIFGQARRDEEKHLIQEFQSAENREEKGAVAYLMGRYRMKSAVDVLSANITLTMPMRRPLREALIPDSPVVGALIEIGQPSIPYMLKLIENSEKDAERQAAMTVIRFVEGPELSPILLELQIKKAEDPQKKERFEKALADLNELLARQGFK